MPSDDLDDILSDDDAGGPAAAAAAGGGIASQVVPPELDGQRLDRMLAAAPGSLSRSRLQALVRAGQVQVDGVVRDDPGLRVKAGQTVTVVLPPPTPAEPEAQAIPLKVVYEDAQVIVIDKPAGLVVHPAAGHSSGTLVNALLAHCGESLSGIGGVRRPGIVHRLDKDTSGLLVVAKTDEAHAGLSQQFASHGEDGRLERAYLAVAWGVPPRGKGTIDAPLSRSASNRLKIAVVRDGDGRHAVTHYEVLETFPDVEGAPVASLVRLRLETGRTHQIRVHMAHIGHPLLGDAVYGSGFRTRAARLAPEAQAALDALGRQALHAAELGFEHPVSGRGLRFQSALPPDLQRLVDALRGNSPARGKARTSSRKLKGRG